MTRRARRDVAAAALVAAALVSGVAAPARAQSASDLATARDLFAKAEKDEASHDYAAALDALRRAGAIKMTPGIRFHIALCEENTGDVVKALADYTAAQAQAREENNREVLDVVGDAIEQLRPRVPTVKIVMPDDVGSRARVKLDGKEVPPSGWDVVIPLEVGPHVVEATAPGRATYRASIAAKEHEATVLDVRLAPAPAAPAAAPPRAAPSAPTSARADEGASASAPGGDARTGAVAFTAAAVVLVAGGVGAFLVAGSAQDDARAACATGACDSEKTQVRAWDAVALGSWITAAAAGTIAIVLWTRPSHAARAALHVTPTGASVTAHF